MTFRKNSQYVYKAQIEKEIAVRYTKLATKIYGLTYIHYDNKERYIAACSSDGFICVWDTFSKPQNQSRNINDSPNDGHLPDLSFKVCDHTLYDVQFVDKSPHPLLITCGDGGVFVYVWEDILNVMPETTAAALQNKHQVQIKATSILHPYPSSSRIPTEVNQVSYDSKTGYLFGACGDLFGGYIWDMSTNTIVCTLRQKNDGHCHETYLHTIKSVWSTCGNNHLIITGDDNGEVGIFDGKNQRLIDMIDIKSAMIKCHDNSTCKDNYAKEAFTSSDNNSTFLHLKHENNNTSLWVSSIDVDYSSHWAIIAGGIEYYSDSYGGISRQLDNGFLALVDMHTRTVNSCSTTQENINQVAFCHDASVSIVSVGNNNSVSFWNSRDLSKGRVGKSIASSPSSYAIAVPKYRDGVVAVGGVGSLIDCYTENGTKCSTLCFQSHDSL